MALHTEGTTWIFFHRRLQKAVGTPSPHLTDIPSLSGHIQGLKCPVYFVYSEWGLFIHSFSTCLHQSRGQGVTDGDNGMMGHPGGLSTVPDVDSALLSWPLKSSFSLGTSSATPSEEPVGRTYQTAQTPQPLCHTKRGPTVCYLSPSLSTHLLQPVTTSPAESRPCCRPCSQIPGDKSGSRARTWPQAPCPWPHRTWTEWSKRAPSRLEGQLQLLHLILSDRPRFGPEWEWGSGRRPLPVSTPVRGREKPKLSLLLEKCLSRILLLGFQRWTVVTGPVPLSISPARMPRAASSFWDIGVLPYIILNVRLS